LQPQHVDLHIQVSI